MKKLGQKTDGLNLRFMRVSALLLFFPLILLEGAYVPAPSPLDLLHHHVRNQEVEIRAFEKKLENFQEMLEEPEFFFQPFLG